MNTIHQIELTSRCNLRCRYCVHPHMKRKKEDMTLETYERVLYWVSRFVREGTQGRELNLAGIGESTMHPDFKYMVMMARKALGYRGRNLILATNGLLIDEEMTEILKKFDVYTWVSLHRPEKAANAVNLLRKVGMLKGISVDPSTASVDWAGQIDWPVTAEKSECTWLKENRAFVMVNGDITRCCFDGEGIGCLCHVSDDITQFNSSEYELCKQCHLTIPRTV